MLVVLGPKMEVFDKWRLNRREQAVCNEGTNYIIVTEVLECVQHTSVRAAEGDIYFNHAGWSHASFPHRKSCSAAINQLSV